MRYTAQLAIVAFASAVLGAASTIGFWVWYATRDISVGRPAVGQPRIVLVRCSPFDSVEVVFERPLLPASEGEPDHATLRLSGTAVEELRVTEKVIVANGLRYRYDPIVEVRMSDLGAQQLSEAERQRGPVSVSSAYRLAIEGHPIGNADLFGKTAERTLIFESRKYSFDELASWLGRLPGCSSAPGAA